MTSIIIPYRNDPFIFHTLDALCDGVEPSKIEVIVIDDASDEPLTLDKGKYPNVTVWRTEKNCGVGASFDRGVHFAQHNNLILMGSDVIVRDKLYLHTVSQYLSEFPESIGCSTCVRLSPENLNPYDKSLVRHYGATLVPLLDDSKDTTLLATRWINEAPLANRSEIPCLLGAFYFTTKSWYNHIGGFDGEHKRWGCLEPWISIKTWLAGGSIHVLSDLETGHVFNKYGDGSSVNGRGDMAWYNKLFVAYTQLPEDLAKRIEDKVYSLRIQREQSTLPFNLGRNILRQNWNRVLEVRERNKQLFVHDFAWLCQKFGIEINF